MRETNLVSSCNEGNDLPVVGGVGLMRMSDLSDEMKVAHLCRCACEQMAGVGWILEGTELQSRVLHWLVR